MVKRPSEWSDEDRHQVIRALSEHRVNRVDLHLWQEVDHRGRGVREVAEEFMLTGSEMDRRVALARDRVKELLEGPAQEAFLGKWIDR